MDLFSEALAMADSFGGATGNAAQLVNLAGGSIERVMEAEQRARALERELPADPRAHRVHELLRDAARLAMKTPSHAHPRSLSDRIADITGSAETHVVDGAQMAAELERLRGA